MYDATSQTRIRTALQAAHKARSDAFANGLAGLFGRRPRGDRG